MPIIDSIQIVLCITVSTVIVQNLPGYKFIGFIISHFFLLVFKIEEISYLITLYALINNDIKCVQFEFFNLLIYYSFKPSICFILNSLKFRSY